MNVCRRCRGVDPQLPYMAWHHDAARRAKRGQKQRRCPGCSLYEWNPEFAPAERRSE